MADRDPDIRASDMDRERTIAILREHTVEGRLDTAEFSDRVGRAYEAVTLGELARAVDHLPPIICPVGPPRSRRQRALLRRHEKALIRWERTRTARKSQLELAQGGNLGHDSEFPCLEGERILARVPKTTLRVWTTTPGHTERRTATRYQRNLFGGGRRVGTTRTYQVPGRDVQVKVDVGVLYLTNQRIGFRGPKRTLEFSIRGTNGVSVNPASRKVVVSLAGARPVTFRYPADPLGHTAFAAQLALAQSHGTVSSLVAGLQAEIEELDRNQPELAPEALAPVPEKVARRRIRPEGRGDDGGSPSYLGSRPRDLVRSWWLLLTLPLGLTTWLAFWFAAKQTRRPDLLVAAAGYAVVLVLGLVMSGLGLHTASGDVLAVMWIVGIIHALVVRHRTRL